MFREIKLLSELSKIKSNIFTTRLLKIIAPADNEDFNHLFLVMDYVQYDLESAMMKSMDQSMQLEESHVKVILYNLLCSIKFLHSANIMHRDIKPVNVLLSIDSEVKICDFGLARSIAAEDV